MELEKAYIAKEYEDAIYKKWESSGAFAPKKKWFSKPFTVSMPPPNATGTLHLGHAIMLALEDIMIRYKRMRGYAALWVPGTDHASIATQNKVEQLIAKEGKTRHDLGRENFLKRVNEFVKSSQNTIRNQIRKMGSSCDWTRERYTLDHGLSEAVQEVFIRMYRDGLIYRGDRIVNWCPRCASTLADDEVEYQEEKTKLYLFKYDKNFPLIIASTRPETKLGDTAVGVHPDDPRYQSFIGKIFTIQFAGGLPRKIRVIADQNIDPEFGTGVLGITPAHSKIDFEMAKKHKLASMPVIDETGKICGTHPVYGGMDVEKARHAIVKHIEEEGLMKEIKDLTHNLSVCYRCGTAVEPLISKQWFISVDKKFRRGKSLKDIAIEVVRKGKIRILPESFKKIYFHWMENLHDWCISRQIWFGHRIPAWYCSPSCPPAVQKEAPKKCPHCGERNMRQDPDTLDTWFSSGLWTFSTLGWPKKTADLKYFHPTAVLETGYDIIFFWVARMILMTTYALDEVPFKTVYLHGLVRTRDGLKMTKSKPETCIDPLDMIAKYGADALRLSMIVGSAPGNDIRLYEEKIAGYRNFVNKIWNAARFALLNIEEKDKHSSLKKSNVKSLADRWILSRTQEIIEKVTARLEAYEFSEAGTLIYDFTWGEYCAWYLEFSKGEHKNPAVLVHVLKTILKLLHPFVPYVTEVLWGKLAQKTLLIAEAWPKVESRFLFKKEAAEMQTVIDNITEIRKMKQENGIDPVKKVHAIIFGSKRQIHIFKENKKALMRLANISNLDLHDDRETLPADKVQASLSSFLVSGVEIFLPIKDLVDVDAERKKLTKEIEEARRYIAQLETRLNNTDFRKRAPAAVVKQDEERLAGQAEKLKKMEEKLAKLY